MNEPGGQYKVVVMQSAATATGNGTAIVVTDLDTGGLLTLTAQIKGITVATVTWEGTINGSDWVALLFTLMTSGVAATTATADGIYTATVKGLIQVRARISAYTSGTITVTGVAVA